MSRLCQTSGSTLVGVGMRGYQEIWPQRQWVSVGLTWGEFCLLVHILQLWSHCWILRRIFSQYVPHFFSPSLFFFLFNCSRKQRIPVIVSQHFQHKPDLWWTRKKLQLSPLVGMWGKWCSRFQIQVKHVSNINFSIYVLQCLSLLHRLNGFLFLSGCFCALLLH